MMLNVSCDQLYGQWGHMKDGHRSLYRAQNMAPIEAFLGVHAPWAYHIYMDSS